VSDQVSHPYKTTGKLPFCTNQAIIVKRTPSAREIL